MSAQRASCSRAVVALTLATSRGHIVSDGRPEGWEGYWTIPPVQDFVGMKLNHADATVELPLSDNVRGWGPVHGGVLGLLADTCCALAAMTVLDSKREMPATTDIQVRYFKQPRGGPIRAKGSVISRGSKTITAECDVHDGQDRLIAKATGSYTIFEWQKRTDIHPTA